MNRSAFIAALLVLFASAPAAHAEDDPPVEDCRSNCGVLDPSFTNSPVNIYVCTVPNACKP